jgi:CRP-like cAMP-binding protein
LRRCRRWSASCSCVTCRSSPTSHRATSSRSRRWRENGLYEDGTFIAREGDAGNELLVIVDGEVGVVTEGTEIARCKRGDYVGEMAVVDGEPRSASLVARGTVRALRIGRRELETILRERPETSHAMLVVLTRRVRELSRAAAVAR